MKAKLHLRLAVVVSVTAQLHATSAATRYVWQASPSPGPPYTSWATAAHVIQDAVDAAVAGDEIVVTNGIYATGGRVVGTNVLVNRVAVDKPLTVRSVNGPEVTIIKGAKTSGGGNGDGAIRCVYLADGASLSGFTLTNGTTRTSGDFDHEMSGGGVWCESTDAVLSNCVVTGNSASGNGGGAFYGTLDHCVLSGNLADLAGGASESVLRYCTLTGNLWDGAAMVAGRSGTRSTIVRLRTTRFPAVCSGAGVAGLWRRPCPPAH